MFNLNLCLFIIFAVMKSNVREIELLAPARDADTAIEAIKHGADAIYIGASSHGARSAAGNSVRDIARVVDYAHQFNARVYVTLNTLIYDNEVSQVEHLVNDLYKIGTDALIVQDMGLLRMDIPPIALHASTQCDTRTVDKARFLHSAGFSRIVVAREMSIDEIGKIHGEIPGVEIEAFVHGALCVSYSGDCRASLVTTGRSANRGECAQLCRYRYDLIDGNGETLIRDKHLLSLRDMNRSAQLLEMMEAGVNSFKIEGRLKDTPYVKNITAYYSTLLNDIIALDPGRFKRTSEGKSSITFTPDPARSFNRGFTDYFTAGNPRPDYRIASIDTPKWHGREAAVVKGNRGQGILVKPLTDLHNGDGLGYFDTGRRFKGFRLNRIDNGTLIFPATPLSLRPGTILYRNHDKVFSETLSGDTATRTIPCRMTLRTLPQGNIIALDIRDCRGNTVTVTTEITPSIARTPQEEARLKALSKTGGTIYTVTSVDDMCGDTFIPLSTLSTLRRQGLDALDSAQRITYRREMRLAEDKAAVAPPSLSFHDNVANRKARSFYLSHGTSRIEPASEAKNSLTHGDTVMTCRYCLRREMGRCLKTNEGGKWKEPLTLRSDSVEFRLEFDCKACRMNVTLP